MLPSFTRGAPHHDVITLTGGAIGQSFAQRGGRGHRLPGSACAGPCGDGSAMYTIQALWTMAREKLNVTTVIFNNRSYAILNVELQRVGATGKGEKALSQLDLNNPGWTLCRWAMAWACTRCGPPRQKSSPMRWNTRCSPGPHLIEAVVPNAFSGLKLASAACAGFARQVATRLGPRHQEQGGALRGQALSRGAQTSQRRQRYHWGID